MYKFTIYLLLPLLIYSCAPINKQHGYMIEDIIQSMDEMDIDSSIENSLLKRIGSSEDIVCAVEYLLKSDFVTGTILPVDGGRKIF